MIESCSSKRMLIGTVCLGILTFAVLILESHLADTLSGGHKMKNRTFPTENNSTCWMHQNYKVIDECHPCTKFEIKSKSIGVCIHTHFKEVLRCENGETVTRSCDRVAYLEEKAFWNFALWSFFIGIASSFATLFRLRMLNRKARRTAQQRLANGIS